MNQQKSSIQLGFGQVSRLIGIADFEGPIHQLLKRFAAGQNIACPRIWNIKVREQAVVSQPK